MRGPQIDSLERHAMVRPSRSTALDALSKVDLLTEYDDGGVPVSEQSAQCCREGVSARTRQLQRTGLGNASQLLVSIRLADATEPVN
jgi:hypothetical protein